MDAHGTKTRVTERLLTRPSGATMREIIAATGSPQYNEFKRLAARGYTLRKVKEGSETRYFAAPPAAPSYEATVTSKRQMTIPKAVRERLAVRAGSKVRMTVEEGNRVVMTGAGPSIRDLFGILGRPPRRAGLEQMDAAVRPAVAEKYRRAGGAKRR